MIGSKFSRHFFNQSEVKPKPIVARAFTFSRALCRLGVIISSFDWFTGLSPSFLIGQSNYFGFGFTTLNWNSLYAQYECFLIISFRPGGDGQGQPKSRYELLAEQRDYKRRRQSYRAKNVHITKRSAVEVGIIPVWWPCDRDTWIMEGFTL